MDHRNIKNTTIFPSGGIEMGKAALWHEDSARRIASAWDGEGDIHNPRRAGEFRQDMELDQIRWEQRRLLSCDYIFMVIDTHAKSPISLLEFGGFMASGKMIVVCPESFYRYNNLVITAGMYGQRIFQTISEGIAALSALSHRMPVGNEMIS
jgi:hypothetical protein